MEFTSLNVILISGGSVTLGAIGTMASMFRLFVTKESCKKQHANDANYVTRDACAAQHRYDSKTVEDLAELIEKIQRNTDIQFRMLRAMVAHMDLTPEQRAAILNAGPSESKWRNRG